MVIASTRGVTPIATMLMLVALLATGCSASIPSRPTASLKTPTATPPSGAPSGKPTSGTTMALRPGDPRELGDPRASGCSVQAVALGPLVPVMGPDGKPFASLQLRYSPYCRTTWARVQDIARTGVPMRVETWRGAKGPHAAYEDDNGGPALPVFANMLAAEAGCVFARARVAGGPVAATPCTDEPPLAAVK